MFFKSLNGGYMRKKMSHKLTKEQKIEILKLIDEGFSPLDIASKFEVSTATIYNVRKRRDDSKANN
jgi:DNA-binding NarL/FixJ family response regulator